MLSVTPSPGAASIAAELIRECCSVFDQAIKLDPNKADAWNVRCFSRAAIEQLERAIEDCIESPRLEPNSPAALDSRDFTYLWLGQFDTAITNHDAALRAAPNLLEALYGRGRQTEER